jgi:uncharacterized membrane protein (UPF0127 family)
VARVINETRQVVLGHRVSLARTFGLRLRGLIGRRAWGEHDGLWIEPCAGVHSLGLRFAIDVVLVDEAHAVLWLGTIEPWRLGRMHLDARAALELPAGTLVRSGTTVGDRLAVEGDSP